MSRRAQDPVDAAFDRWAELTPEQKKHFAWAMEGYNSARRDAIRDNGGVEPERVAPRTRQRKVKHIDITNRPDVVMSTFGVPPKTA